MSRRRLKGSGTVYCPKGKNTLYMRFKGRRISTGLLDTVENRRALRESLDRAYMKFKLDGVNVFSNAKNLNGNTVGTAWDSFEKLFLPAKQHKTQTDYKTAYTHFFPDPALPMRTDVLTEELLKGLHRRRNIKGEQKTLSSISVNTYLRAVKVFLRWSHKRGLLTDVPDFGDIKAHIKREPTPDPEIYTSEELIAIHAWFKNHNPEVGLAFEVAIVTGFRIHEIMELKHSQLRDDHILMVSKDFRRTERFPLWSHAEHVFDKIRKRAPVDEEEHVFTFHDIKQYYRLRVLLNQAMSECEIEKRGRAWHELRKTFISRVLRSGVPVVQACRICRCTINVMMKYYHAFSIAELHGSMESVRKSETKKSKEFLQLEGILSAES